MSFDPHVLTSADQLRALAHPVRMAIIERLLIAGAQTATELGEALDETPANCSWHLRKLADQGFIEEAGEARGRRRPWRLTRVGFRWSDDTKTGTQTRAMAHTLVETMVRRHVERFLRHSTGPSWGGTGVGDAILYLTEEESVALLAEFHQARMRYIDRLTDPSLRPEGARAVYVLNLSSVDPSETPDRKPGAGENQ